MGRYERRSTAFEITRGCGARTVPFLQNELTWEIQMDSTTQGAPVPVWAWNVTFAEETHRKRRAVGSPSVAWASAAAKACSSRTKPRSAMESIVWFYYTSA